MRIPGFHGGQLSIRKVINFFSVFSMSTHLSPSFAFVRNAHQIRVPFWKLLTMLEEAETPMFVRSAERKPRGANITVFDASLNTLFRSTSDRGIKCHLKAIAEKNPAVRLLKVHEYVTPDRKGVEMAESIGSHMYYGNPGLTD